QGRRTPGEPRTQTHDAHDLSRSAHCEPHAGPRGTDAYRVAAGECVEPAAERGRLDRLNERWTHHAHPQSEPTPDGPCATDDAERTRRDAPGAGSGVAPPEGETIRT